MKKKYLRLASFFSSETFATKLTNIGEGVEVLDSVLNEWGLKHPPLPDTQSNAA